MMDPNSLKTSPEFKRALIAKTLKMNPSLAEGRSVDSVIDELCGVLESPSDSKKGPAQNKSQERSGLESGTKSHEHEETLAYLASGIAKKYKEAREDILRKQAALEKEATALQLENVEKIRTLIETLAAAGQPLPVEMAVRACKPFIEALGISEREFRRLVFSSG